LRNQEIDGVKNIVNQIKKDSKIEKSGTGAGQTILKQKST
jgi:hypothetical protein